MVFMTEPLPKWIQTRYAVLWNKFKNKEFNHKQACSLLKLEKEVISVLLSDLKKAGWLEVSLNSEDGRKRIYRLKNPEEALKEMIK